MPSVPMGIQVNAMACHHVSVPVKSDLQRFAPDTPKILHTGALSKHYQQQPYQGVEQAITNAKVYAMALEAIRE